MTDAAERFADGAAYIDDCYVPIAEAKIPITDWGVVRSDVTYDVVAVWNGAYFRLQDHLDRFMHSVERLRMRCPYKPDEITEILSECVRLAGLREAYVEMVLTRGVPPRGSRDPRTFENRFYGFAIPYVWIVQPEAQEQGINLIISKVPRIAPESVDPTVKNFHWGDLVRGLFEAYERGGETAVLTDGSGNITEGPGFNIFSVKAGRMTTPARGVLLGITRKTVIDLAETLNAEVEVGVVTEQELRRADEIFICSTAGGVMPVSHLDGRPVSDGAPGPLTLRLRELYWAAHEDSPWRTPIDYSASC